MAPPAACHSFYPSCCRCCRALLPLVVQCVADAWVGASASIPRLLTKCMGRSKQGHVWSPDWIDWSFFVQEGGGSSQSLRPRQQYPITVLIARIAWIIIDCGHSSVKIHEPGHVPGKPMYVPPAKCASPVTLGPYWWGEYTRRLLSAASPNSMGWSFTCCLCGCGCVGGFV